MKRLLAALLLAALVTSTALASGTTALLAWVAPTAYSNGITLAPTEIAYYTITYTVGPSNQSLQVLAPALSTTVVVSCASTTFTISVTTTATATYPNATSGASSGVPYASGVTCVPNAPSGFTAK
jgi:hypothetical protein